MTHLRAFKSLPPLHKSITELIIAAIIYKQTTQVGAAVQCCSRNVNKDLSVCSIAASCYEASTPIERFYKSFFINHVS